MQIEEIARVAHGINKAYCDSLGDYSQLPWEQAPEWQRISAVKGVKFYIENPDASPSHIHEQWLAEKFATGWKYGAVKDPAKKEHPCCVSFDELPKEQKTKDFLFTQCIRSLFKISRDSVNISIENNFKYHAPKEGQQEKYQALRAKGKEFAHMIDELCPASREQSLAMTKLEESVMWSNASIARN